MDANVLPVTPDKKGDTLWGFLPYPEKQYDVVHEKPIGMFYKKYNIYISNKLPLIYILKSYKVFLN